LFKTPNLFLVPQNPILAKSINLGIPSEHKPHTRRNSVINNPSNKKVNIRTIQNRDILDTIEKVQLPEYASSPKPSFAQFKIISTLRKTLKGDTDKQNPINTSPGTIESLEGARPSSYKADSPYCLNSYEAANFENDTSAEMGMTKEDSVDEELDKKIGSMDFDDKVDLSPTPGSLT
jgi:hypothetical protein